MPLEAPVTRARGRVAEASMRSQLPATLARLTGRLGLADVAAGLGVLERALERLHEVGGGRGLLLRRGHLDLAPLALGVDDALEPGAIAVVVALGVPVGGELLDDRDGPVELLL